MGGGCGGAWHWPAWVERVRLLSEAGLWTLGWHRTENTSHIEDHILVQILNRVSCLTHYW